MNDTIQTEALFATTDPHIFVSAPFGCDGRQFETEWTLDIQARTLTLRTPDGPVIYTGPTWAFHCGGEFSLTQAPEGCLAPGCICVGPGQCGMPCVSSPELTPCGGVVPKDVIVDIGITTSQTCIDDDMGGEICFPHVGMLFDWPSEMRLPFTGGVRYHKLLELPRSDGIDLPAGVDVRIDSCQSGLVLLEVFIFITAPLGGGHSARLEYDLSTSSVFECPGPNGYGFERFREVDLFFRVGDSTDADFPAVWLPSTITVRIPTAL